MTTSLKFYLTLENFVLEFLTLEDLIVVNYYCKLKYKT